MTSELIDKISLPPNIGDILKTIKNVTASTSTKVVQSMEVDDEEYVPAGISDISYEYKSSALSYSPASTNTSTLFIPPVVAAIDPITMDIDERIFPQMSILPPVVSSSSDSKLGQMTDEELINLVPDDAREPN